MIARPDLVLTDPKIRALVRLAAAIAVGAADEHLRKCAADASRAGASDREVVGTLLAVASEIGVAGTVSSTTGVALGLGYDIDHAFEDLPSDSG